MSRAGVCWAGLGGMQVWGLLPAQCWRGFVAPGYALGGKHSLFYTQCYSELTLGVGYHVINGYPS